MGVYIKNMKMPTECRMCVLCDYSTITGLTICVHTGTILADKRKPIEFEGRAESCQLVEVFEVEDRRCNHCRHYQGVHNVQGHAPCALHNIGGVMWDDSCKQFDKWEGD